MRGNNAHAVSGRVSHMKSVYLDGDEGSESQTQRKSEASVIIQKIVRGRSSRIKHLKLAPKLTGAEHDGDVNVTVLPAAGRYAGVLKPVISCSPASRSSRLGFQPCDLGSRLVDTEDWWCLGGHGHHVEHAEEHKVMHGHADKHFFNTASHHVR